MEVLIAASSIDAGIGSWDPLTGKERLRYKSCASPPHGLVAVGSSRFIAATQLRDSTTSGSILYWSWHKPQVEAKSFPAEPIKPLVSNSEGTYLIGGGNSGDIYVWEVLTGRLLKKWHAHYRAVSCLVLSDDESLLISGAEDGCVRVWSLFMMFDDIRREEARQAYVYSFLEHSLPVTDVAAGHGRSNALIVSASEDRTCKVWSLATGRFLRNIVFPSIIDAIALDPGEQVFYAGGRDGKIYIAALTATSPSDSNHGTHIIGTLSDHSKAVACLSFCADGVTLISGSEDGFIRMWDTRTRNIVRMFRHAKGPVTNVLSVRLPETILKSQASSHGRKHLPLLSPPLEKYANPVEENVGTKAFIGCQATLPETLDVPYVTEQVMNNQIEEFQHQGSAAAAEMEVERIKLECKKAKQMAQQWKNMYENLHKYSLTELLHEDQAQHTDGISS